MKRLASILLLLFLGAVAGCGASAQATPGGAEPMLTYPPTAPTPTMGQPPRQTGSSLASADASPRSVPELLADWQVVDVPQALPGEGGRWIAREGHLAQDGVNPAASLSASETALMSPDVYGNVLVSVAFYDTSNGNVGLIARHSRAGFYRVRLQTDPSYAGEALVLEKIVGGTAVPLLINAGEPLYERHVWHTLTLSVQNTTIVATLDGAVVAQVEDAAPLPAGQVGIGTRALGGIFFDRLTLAAEE